MEQITRRSAVAPFEEPTQTTIRDGWCVALTYPNEGNGPYWVDLSHRAKWDLQDREIDGFSPFGCNVPDQPGKSIYQEGFLLSRLNRTQAVIWHLHGISPLDPKDSAFTNITDAFVLFALIGEDVFSIAEKLCSLDLRDRGLDLPRVHQGPFCHVLAQMVVMEKRGGVGTLLVACSRGYAADLVHAIVEAGREFGLRPAGEKTFERWLSAGE